MTFFTSAVFSALKSLLFNTNMDSSFIFTSVNTNKFPPILLLFIHLFLYVYRLFFVAACSWALLSFQSDKVYFLIGVFRSLLIWLVYLFVAFILCTLLYLFFFISQTIFIISIYLFYRLTGCNCIISVVALEFIELITVYIYVILYSFSNSIKTLHRYTSFSFFQHYVVSDMYLYAITPYYVIFV